MSIEGRSTDMAQSTRRSSRASPRSSTRRPASTPAEVELDKSFTDDLDIDSLSMMTIVVNAEEKFGVRIPDDEVKNLKTVR
jgi:acyl carrier protein